MKKKLIGIGISLMLFIYGGCTQSVHTKEIIYVPVKDTIGERDNISKIIYLEKTIKEYKDSLNYIRDSVGEDLFVARYKLARIKEYNRIAAKGNNIKYLRGWLNRVLEE